MTEIEITMGPQPNSLESALAVSRSLRSSVVPVGTEKAVLATAAFIFIQIGRRTQKGVLELPVRHRYYLGLEPTEKPEVLQASSLSSCPTLAKLTLPRMKSLFGLPTAVAEL